MNNHTPCRVYLSYSHDSRHHIERVRSLADRLRVDGIDAMVDAYVATEGLNWFRWIQDQIDKSDFILVVVTESYERRFSGKEESERGRGVQFEGMLITEEMYRPRTANKKFIPVVFTANDIEYIPRPLAGLTWYALDSEANYLALLRRIGATPLVEPHPLGRNKSTNLPPPEVYKLPIPPPQLVDAFRNKEGVAYVGAGLSALGLQTWGPFIGTMLNTAIKRGLVDSENGEALHQSFEDGELDLVADSLVDSLSRDAVVEIVQETIGNQGNPTACHKLLRDLNLSAVLTTNFDNLLEATFHRSSVFTPADSEELLIAHAKRAFFILKLSGDLSRPEGLMLASAHYEKQMAENRQFARFMETLFYSRTLLFIGSSLGGISAYLRAIDIPQVKARRHYALAAINSRSSIWKIQATTLEKRYGIRVLPYTSTEGHPEVLEFLTKLRGLTIDRRQHSWESPRPKADPLKRLILENIGPFHELEIDLDPHWNIALGNNGVGKSHILRAVALALLGQEAGPWASRLIRNKASKATVILETAKKTFRTVIHRVGDQAEIESFPSRPLEDLNFVAIGFPPLRTIGWERPTGPQSDQVGRKRPVAADLMPLIQGGQDPRIVELKQWLVNHDYWYQRDKKQKIYRKIVETFFRIAGEVTEGMALNFEAIHPQSQEIALMTADGIVPLEAVSQGAASLMGWIGILLQRVSEISGHQGNPTRQYGVVLLDELDAHLHPGWQRQLIPKLTKIFPNIQFIVTTHSPLVVAGRSPSQIIHIARNIDGILIRKPVEAEMTAGRADQILTGDLFGLETTQDLQTEADLDRFSKLLENRKTLNESEAKELEALRIQLRYRIPLSAEGSIQRQAHSLLRYLLQSQAGDLFPEAQEAVLKEGDKLVAQLLRRRGLVQ